MTEHDKADRLARAARDREVDWLLSWVLWKSGYTPNNDIILTDKDGKVHRVKLWP